ncbi:4-oxalomesaconate tautomerase [Pseudomonas sp. DY-1]|nr:4-oxalomesaconate tautomerase [Pseudomonas sp. DY-1]MRK23704.1 4-oxalomesaconate tautomerase [Pseudomonas sp. JG-B]
MMNSIPCMIMRGGTSRGPFIHMTDLPDSQEARAQVLLDLMGSGHPLQVDGIGGGNSLTSKVAIVGHSSRPDADVDYLFAQVDVTERRVDFTPNCGNMLSAVGPFAIETGLVAPTYGETRVRVFNINTQRIIECFVPTPRGRVEYEGDTSISGVPGSAAGIRLSFLDVAGAKTGALLPTGHAIEQIEGVDVTCLDAATPTVMIRASDLGVDGHADPASLDANSAMLERLERIRCEAGRRMGMGDVSQSVLPKPILLSSAVGEDGTLCARYFVPQRCHKALAVTGAIALGAAVNVPGSVAHRLALETSRVEAGQPLASIRIEHPSGHLDLRVELRDGNPMDIARVSLIRTARKIMDGRLYYRMPDAVH